MPRRKTHLQYAEITHRHYVEFRLALVLAANALRISFRNIVASLFRNSYSTFRKRTSGYFPKAWA